LLASGINLGIMRCSGAGFGGIFKAAAYFIFGLMMLRAALCGGDGGEKNERE